MISSIASSISSSRVSSSFAHISSSLAYQYCGDGVLQTPREVCDDGNLNNDDGCSTTCQITFYPNCGNVRLDVGEECDDGNIREGDGCTALCKHEQKFCIGDDCNNTAYCGDSIVQSALGEQCDDGNRTDNDDCDNACKWVPLPECGDGVMQPDFEQCDEGSEDMDRDGEVNSNMGNAVCRINCTLPYCGDGYLDDFIEECDDGDNLNGDGCSAVCILEAGAAPPLSGNVAFPGRTSRTSSTVSPGYTGYIPTPARTPTGPGLVIFLASGAAAGAGLVRRRFLNRT